jgi:Tol biopolymer transport system component
MMISPRPSGYPNTDSRPTWSPDSRRVLAEVGGEAIVANRDAPSNGESFGQTPSWVNLPDWSPQGDKVAFSAFTSRAEGQEATWGIYTCDADGKNYERIIHDAKQPEWNPQGDKIAYHLKKGTSRAHLSVANADGSNPHTVGSGGILQTDWSWDPQGHQLAYDTYKDGIFQIRVADFTGKKDRILTDGDGGFYKDRTPEWSPLGDKVVFERHDRAQPKSDLWTIELKTGKKKQITSFPRRVYDPTWSPDGKTIAFTSNMDNPNDYDLFLMDSDGKNPRKISDRPGDEYAPSWSPDGKAIAFTRLDWNKHDEGRYSLHIHEVE